jgi:epoxyqueuosine reductase QueG
MQELEMENLSEALREFAKKKGADLVGFASVERFSVAPERYRPGYYVDDAKSVISIGMRMTKAEVNALRLRKSVFSYQHFSNSLLYGKVDTIGYEVSRFLEDRGFTAYPFPANSPKDAYDSIADFSHKHAAVAAGLGEIGWSYLFLSPQFGPRQIITSVVTDALLRPDPILEDALCKPTECGFKCVRVCPVGAISDKESYSFEMGERRFEHGKHSRERCLFGCSSMYSIMSMPETPLTMRDLNLGSYREKLEKSNQRGMLEDQMVKNLHFSKINEGEYSWCYVGCLSHCPVGQD